MGTINLKDIKEFVINAYKQALMDKLVGLYNTIKSKDFNPSYKQAFEIYNTILELLDKIEKL